MGHNEFTIRAPMEPQEASLMKPAMSVLGIDMVSSLCRNEQLSDRN
jgi:hypothetical protein